MEGEKAQSGKGKGLGVLGSGGNWAHASRSPCLWGEGSAEHAAPHSGQEPHVAWGRSAAARVNPLRGALGGARGASLGAQMVKSLPAVWETRV